MHLVLLLKKDFEYFVIHALDILGFSNLSTHVKTEFIPHTFENDTTINNNLLVIVIYRTNDIYHKVLRRLLCILMVLK